VDFPTARELIRAETPIYIYVNKRDMPQGYLGRFPEGVPSRASAGH
jgi:hypothetical protein